MGKKNEIAAIDCTEAVKRFNDFLDNYLKGKERKELMNHLATCKQCFNKLEFEQLLKAKVATIGNITEKDKEQARKQVEKILSKV